MAQTEVLIVGAGPTGLVLALWLTKLGVKVRIIDKTAEPGTTSRALGRPGAHARTLPAARPCRRRGRQRAIKVPAVNLWVKGERAARLAFEKRRRGADALPLPAYLPAGPARAAADRAAGGARRRGRAAHRTDPLQRRRKIASLPACADADGAEEIARRPTSPAATARARSCARPSAPAFPAAPIGSSSTSPTSKPPVPRSTANCTSISTRPISSPSFRWPGRDARA